MIRRMTLKIIKQKQCNITTNTDPDAEMEKKMKMSSTTSVYFANFTHVLLSTITFHKSIGYYRVLF